MDDKVMGQLIFKARIDYSLWERILDFATDEANDGYTRLLEYLEEPVNCHCELIEGTKWCEIKLGADSFRESEWQAIHKIIAIVVDYAVHDIESVQYYEWQGLRPNKLYMDPFYPEEDEEE